MITFISVGNATSFTNVALTPVNKKKIETSKEAPKYDSLHNFLTELGYTYTLYHLCTGWSYSLQNLTLFSGVSHKQETGIESNIGTLHINKYM